MDNFSVTVAFVSIALMFLANFTFSIGCCYLYDVYRLRKDRKSRFSKDTIMFYKYLGKHAINVGTLVDIESDTPGCLNGLYLVSQTHWKRISDNRVKITVTYEPYDPPTLADFQM